MSQTLSLKVRYDYFHLPSSTQSDVTENGVDQRRVDSEQGTVDTDIIIIDDKCDRLTVVTEDVVAVELSHVG